MPNNSITSVTTKKYLETIRQASNYPTFRAFVSFMTLLMFVLAGLIVVVAVGTGQMGVIGAALIGALCLALISKVIAEVSLMIADIADSTIYTSANQIFLKSQPTADEGQSSQVLEPEQPNYAPPLMANEEENKLPIAEKVKRWW